MPKVIKTWLYRKEKKTADHPSPCDHVNATCRRRGPHPGRTMAYELKPGRPALIWVGSTRSDWSPGAQGQGRDDVTDACRRWNGARGQWVTGTEAGDWPALVDSAAWPEARLNVWPGTVMLRMPRNAAIRFSYCLPVEEHLPVYHDLPAAVCHHLPACVDVGMKLTCSSTVDEWTRGETRVAPASP